MESQSTGPIVIDTATNVRVHAKALFARGVRVVIRYYTSNMGSGKLLRLDEARALSEAGLGIAVVYQVAQNKRSDFDRERGKTAGNNAWRYAMQTIGQPAGSAIYFAVDYDASTHDVEQAIVPYCEAARAQLRPGDPMQSYRIGVYGSGRVCALLDRGLVELPWLSAASSWAGYQEFLGSDPTTYSPAARTAGSSRFRPKRVLGEAVGEHRVIANRLWRDWHGLSTGEAFAVIITRPIYVYR